MQGTQRNSWLRRSSSAFRLLNRNCNCKSALLQLLCASLPRWWYVVGCLRWWSLLCSWHHNCDSGSEPCLQRMWHRWYTARRVWTCSSRQCPCPCISSLAGLRPGYGLSRPRTRSRYPLAWDFQEWKGRSCEFCSASLQPSSGFGASIGTAWRWVDWSCWDLMKLLGLKFTAAITRATLKLTTDIDSCFKRLFSC